MKVITEYRRIQRLITDAIAAFALDLRGMNVLTEAASGAFVVTPLIAAMAGADPVIAVTRDSSYGSCDEVSKYVKNWATFLDVADRISIGTSPSAAYATTANIVTNLGFVRPINRTLIERLPNDAAIPLMWEPWEFRSDDIDLDACRMRNVPVLGTNERIPELRIFHYVGLTVLKALFELDIEVFRSRIVVIGSGFFGDETVAVLKNNGATIMHIDPAAGWNPDAAELRAFLTVCDAVVTVEHVTPVQLIGSAGGLSVTFLKSIGCPIVHICGSIDYQELRDAGIRIHPGREVAPGSMSVTTDYVGPRPVIDLHTAGLKVGQEMVCGMRMFSSAQKAKQHALQNSPAMDFPT